MGRLHSQSALALAALLAAPFVAAQFSVESKLVRLLVSVKDARGEPIGTLERGDFQVFDTGVEQTITVFEHNTLLPLSVSVLIDVSGTVAKDLDYEVNAVEKFFQGLLRGSNPEDEVAVYAFNDDVELLTSFTRRQQRLRDGLRRLKAKSGTSLYDAIYLAARDLQDRDGRHVMVVVTDGGDTTSAKPFSQARDAVQFAEATLYPIVVVPISNDAGRNLGGERALERLASDTGGKVFTPNLGPQLDRAFAEILRDLRTQYLLAYQPRGLPADAPRFRPLRVEVKRPGLRVITRSGYYGDAAAGK
jgi:Ca-activated chloride channel family protein